MGRTSSTADMPLPAFDIENLPVERCRRVIHT
jgi:hypothetical protein